MIKIIKYSGEEEEFDIDRLKRSLRKAKANEDLIEMVADEVQSRIREGMTTHQIYKMAFKLLKRRAPVSASRYKLKKAIMELGPSGFPFENFVARILEREGYKVQVGEKIDGLCVSHEVDILANKGKDHHMIECKFHSTQGRKCDVKVPLYIRSRFEDIDRKWRKDPGNHSKDHQGWVYTNTRFTSDALKYGQCVGLGLASWDYPEGAGLKDRIDRSGLHPLTSLTTISGAEKSRLLDKGVVLCKDLLEGPETLKAIGVGRGRVEKVLDDCRELCKHFNSR